MSAVKTVKVSNVSLEASVRDVKEFFSFSGEIYYLEMKKCEDEQSQTGYVTFKEAQGADTAVLLSGATIVDKMVKISYDPDYQLPPAALQQQSADPNEPHPALQKAEDVVSTMLAQGFLLGKDALARAQSFDEKHQLSTTASAKVASIDQRIGLSEKINKGTAVVNDKVREVDQKYQVTEKTKSAFTVAEQKVSEAGSTIMKNRYVFTSAAWVTGAFNRVAKVAGDVRQKAKEKATMSEEEQRQKVVTDFARVHLADTDSPKVLDAASFSDTPKSGLKPPSDTPQKQKDSATSPKKTEGTGGPEKVSANPPKKAETTEPDNGSAIANPPKKAETSEPAKGTNSSKKGEGEPVKLSAP